MAWLDEESADPSTRRAKSRRIRRVGSPAPQFEAQVASATARLRACDPVLAVLIDRYGPCTLRPQGSYFSVLVETVISQQLSTHAAKAIYGRLVGTIGRRAPRPADISRLPDETLLDIGFSRSKVRCIKSVAEAFRSRRMGPKTFAGMSDDEVMGHLTSIKGIGEWSAHMFLIFALGRLDVFPVGDLGLRNAIDKAYGASPPRSGAWYRGIGDGWRPFRTIGTWYLWESYDNR
jgi:DNA-3-methyladenine glycosylase II